MESYTGLPQAHVHCRTLTAKWRHLVEVKIPAQGQWDQPPTYPNVSSAVKEAITASREEVMNSFFSGR